MWRPHLFRKTDGRFGSQWLSNTSVWRMSDLEGVLATYGDNARYDDEPWDTHYAGRAGVRLFYEQLMNALPDLEIEVQRRYIAEDSIVVEVIIRGTHLGDWRGLAATGRRVEFPLCGIYTFD